VPGGGSLIKNPEEEDPPAPGTNSSRGVLVLWVLDQGT